MMIWCQYATLLLLVTRMLSGLWFAIEGQSAKRPTKFSGVLAVMVGSFIFFCLLYAAGAFSKVLP